MLAHSKTTRNQPPQPTTICNSKSTAAAASLPFAQGCSGPLQPKNSTSSVNHYRKG